VWPLIVPVDRDERHPCFEQPSAKETALAKEVRAVAGAMLLRLALQLQGAADSGRADQVIRLPPDAVEIAESGTITLAHQCVEAVAQQPAVFEPSRRHLQRQAEIGQTKASLIGIALEADRIICLAEKACTLAGELVDGGVLDDLGQRHERRRP